LHQRTGGNPLFVLETLKQAWVEGQLRGDSAATGRTALDLPRPVSVTRLIERRVAQLSAGALALARVAAIAGVDFAVPLAEHVLQVPAMRLADAITELEAAQVLRGNQFAHDLVADAVHGGVPTTVAQHTHAQVAHWLQTHGGEPARVAGHWILAAQPLQALPWLQQAADAARGAVRHREYIHFLETKARIEEDAGQLEAAFESLLPAVAERTGIGHAPSDCQAACDRLDRLARTARQRVQAGLLRTGVHALGGSPAGIATGQATLAAALALGEEQLIMHTHSALAKAYTVADDSTQALHHERQCIPGSKRTAACWSRPTATAAWRWRWTTWARAKPRCHITRGRWHWRCRPATCSRRRSPLPTTRATGCSPATWRWPTSLSRRASGCWAPTSTRPAICRWSASCARWCFANWAATKKRWTTPNSRWKPPRPAAPATWIWRNCAWQPAGGNWASGRG
jgi:hypothetical protein